MICDVVLRVVENYGIGIFANKVWAPDILIEHAIGIPVPRSSIFWNELVNYAEEHNMTHGLISLGISLLFNHASLSRGLMMKKMNAHDSIYKFNDGFGASNDILYVSNEVIFQGYQMFSHYGELYEERDHLDVYSTQNSNPEVFKVRASSVFLSTCEGK